MLRSLCCFSVVLGLSASPCAAESSGKVKTPEVAAKESIKKTEPAKESAIPTWVPKQFLGTPIATRLVKIQEEIDAATAKRGPAREEADKARQAYHRAEQKANDLNQQIKSLETEKQRTMENGNEHLREFALDKADIENAQKVIRLEAQVRELTARLDVLTRPQAAKPAADKPAAKPSPDKPASDKQPSAKDAPKK
jgi:DNA repair exonuclease SbcCD ATPase subunit